jgi:epoxyqueuosine reductase QueG
MAVRRLGAALEDRRFMTVDDSLPDLHQFALDAGLSAYGVADLDALRERRPEAMADAPDRFSRGISLGVRLPDAVLDGLEDGPTALYFHAYRQANYVLDRAAFQLSLRLQSVGWRALPVPASQIVDPLGRRGLVSHRMIGHAAGIGWIGRTRLLVHPQFGARMRYASVLTDAPCPTGEPLDSACGACRACIDACPARAVRERSEDLDLDACHAQLSEFRKRPFIGQHICGVCVRACRGPACV